MLSRFSSLFTYVIVGLVVSATATPMGPLGDLTDGTKALSHPGPSYPMKSYDQVKSYDAKPYVAKPYDAKPYDAKPYDVKPYDAKPYGDAKPYDDDEHKGDSYGQCSTGTQHCCNQVNKADDSSKLESLGLLGLAGMVDVIRSSQGVWGFDCSPFMGGGKACSNKPICCQNNQMNGLVVVGCSNVDLLF